MSKIIKNINKEKLLSSTMEKNSKEKEYLIDKDVYSAEKPIKDMAVTVSDVRNQVMVSYVDTLNNRLMEDFGVFKYNPNILTQNINMKEEFKKIKEELQFSFLVQDMDVFFKCGCDTLIKADKQVLKTTTPQIPNELLYSSKLGSILQQEKFRELFVSSSYLEKNNDDDDKQDYTNLFLLVFQTINIDEKGNVQSEFLPFLKELHKQFNNDIDYLYIIMGYSTNISNNPLVTLFQKIKNINETEDFYYKVMENIFESNQVLPYYLYESYKNYIDKKTFILYKNYKTTSFTDDNKNVTTHYVGPLNLKNSNYIEFNKECKNYNDKQPIKTNKDIVINYTPNSTIIDFFNQLFCLF